MQMSPFPIPPPAGKALPRQSIRHLDAATGSIHNPAPSHSYAGKGKLAHGQVKQQDVFLASFFISRTLTRWYGKLQATARMCHKLDHFPNHPPYLQGAVG